MESKVKKCSATETRVADVLLASDAVPAKVSAHVVECVPCGVELEELRATMVLLDTWEAPEPSPYFLTRLNARLHEERQAAPAGWFENLRARFTYGTHMHTRPLAAMALTVVLLLGGGTYLGMTNWEQPAAPPEAAVVHDLQLLDNNAQLLDQLEAISSTDSNNEN
jgi:hypothetical protein